MGDPLAGKVMIVTGASSGIGRAIARTMAARGARTVLAARSEERLTELADELGAAGADALALPTDVTVAEEVTALVDATLERFGCIDALVANAGVYVPGDVAEGDPDAWAAMVDVNVTGVLRCVRAALPAMIERGSGDVLVTGSISGYQAIHWEPVYSATKHAIRSFVHGLRRQVAPHGIRVGSLAPGMVANELWGLGDAAEIERRVAERGALRSEDVAEIAAFMLSRPPHVTIRDLVVLPQGQDL